MRYDVIVVGAGPAGSTAARYTARRGLKVLLLDKRKEIGGALNYYYNRHNLKVQADFRNLKDTAANAGVGTSTNEFRLQTQFIF